MLQRIGFLLLVTLFALTPGLYPWYMTTRTDRLHPGNGWLILLGVLTILIAVAFWQFAAAVHWKNAWAILSIVFLTVLVNLGISRTISYKPRHGRQVKRA